MQDTAPLSEEFRRAAQICNRARALADLLFLEAHHGKLMQESFDAAKELIGEMQGSVTRHSQALVSLARLKSADDYGAMHCVAVAAMMMVLARQLGMTEAEIHSAGLAGLLHNIGKATLPEDLLNKPGKLTEQELNSVRNYPAEGCRLLQELTGVDPVVLDVCLHHNERIDGSGYPEGLKGDQISIFAKMGAVCSIYDAITSNRPYKEGEDPAKSLHKMAQWAEGCFEPRIFQAFVKSVGVYPIGSLVRLSSGRVGVVMSQSGSLVRPVVQVFYSSTQGMRVMPERIDLSGVLVRSEKIVGREDPSHWRAAELNRFWLGEVADELELA